MGDAARQERLIIFTRYPQPGQTKTRLIPCLGPQGAADLQRRMSERLLNTLCAPATDERIKIEIRYEGGSRKQMRRWLGEKLPLSEQGAGRLDQRMARAFHDAFTAGCRRAVIIGTDIPGITADIVRQAFDALLEKDLVLGPAVDGGYYLIGLRRTSFERARPLLSGSIPWGTDRVLETTSKIASENGLSFSLLATLRDIDRPEDLPFWEDISRVVPESDSRGRVSVIIPALNEADNIEAALRSLHGHRNVEVIVVDGGSSDATAGIARELGGKVLHSARGRAIQMNAGAAAAAGDILLFLHADTQLPPGFEDHVRSAVRRPGVSAGAFELGIDAPTPSLRIMERVANIRSRRAQMPYGDQGIFVSRDVFQRLGGFQPLPIMEDFEFVRQLRKMGKIIILPLAVRTTARRWLRVGVWRTWLINQLVILGYLLKVSPERLARFYHRDKRRR